MDTFFGKQKGAPTPRSNVSASRTAPPNKSLISKIGEALSGKEYISERPENLGTKYKKYGPVSIMSGRATPESKKRALASRKSKRR